MTWKTLGTSMAVVVALAGTPTATAAPATPAPTPAPAAATTISATLAAPTLKRPLKRVLAKVNKQRTKRGLRPMRATSCLTKKVAQPWAKHLAETEQLVHQDLSTVFDTCSGLRRVGENIAYGYTSAAAVMRAWMDSAGHRRNILRPGFRKIGLGLARSSDGTRYWVQDFGG